MFLDDTLTHNMSSPENFSGKAVNVKVNATEIDERASGHVLFDFIIPAYNLKLIWFLFLDWSNICTKRIPTN